jgi:sensor histidine kinase YesM
LVTIKHAQNILRNFAGTKVILLIVICFSFINTKAQQPAHFIFGEEQFRGVQIYDVIQDKDMNYWFATNEGLYYFDYYYYNKIDCDEAKGSSVFNFTMNREGTIYCHNLNNQIFQIKNKSCSLFYELKADESSSDISLTVADDDNLVIGAKHIVVLNKNGKKVLQYPASLYYLSSAFLTKNNGIQFHLSGIDSVLVYEKGVFKKNKLHFLSGSLNTESVLKFFSNYALDLRTKELYSFNASTFELNQLPKNVIFERSQSERIYETEGIIWVTGTLPGTALIDKKITTENYPIYYGDYFISDIYKDKEGNILLSTFDKGVIVIPDTKVPDVIHTFKEDPANALYSDSLFGLMIGTSKGTLMNYLNNKLFTINTEGKRPIEAIYGNHTSNLIVFDNGSIKVYNKKTSTITNIIQASLKDAVILSDNLIYLGTNRGVMKVESDGINTFNTQLLKGVDFRIYSIEYNPEDHCLYASTANGLFTIFPDGNIKPLLIDKKVIYPNYLHFYNGRIYATTKANGILIIQHGEIKSVIHPIINNQEEILKKISIHQNTIIAKSSNGLFQFDMNGKLLKALHSVFGFSSKRIIDFTFHQNQLWVSHSGGVQPINLNYNKTTLQKPFIRLNHILVNDELINPFQTSALNSNQRKIQFIFSSTTLRNHESMHYYYKLDGYDLNWNINNYESNQITYSALAPGNYTFYLKVENQGVFSEPVSYSFTIDAPFYARWWFIAFVIILFLGIVLLVYRWQLNIQRKKSQQINELNASKLTAIQSQMNPHFIFNSLNSIQDLILKGDVEHSYSYITTFSNLVRRTLSYSEKDFIDFDQEIKLLELYLSLEKLRFKKELNYIIDIKNVEDIMLPPLLIQPFIENSLIHGLLHKEGQKNLKITFELNETLICTISDNGIGREKSKAIKLRQRSEHESFSGKAIHKRFEILSSVFEGDFGYKYEDLYENNEAIGTKVILSIPIKHKF